MFTDYFHFIRIFYIPKLELEFQNQNYSELELERT